MKYSIIPKPVRYDEKDGESVIISDKTAVVCVRKFLEVGSAVSEYLHTRSDADENKIVISYAKSIAPEGYALYSENGNVNIKASTVIGAYHAFITLKWMLMQEKKENGKKTLGGFLIEDKPCCRYRGLSFDECSRFFGMETVKKLIDHMAMLKMNVFHWRLSGGYSFRIESKVFPLLNSNGTEEPSTENSLNFYTRRQIEEITAYAKKLHITVMPEFDILNSTAVTAAYPQLSCGGENVKASAEEKHTLCIGGEDAFKFIKELSDEICPLFPGRYFYIGGSKARRANRKKCEKCSALMTEKGFKKEKQLQVYFMNRIAEIFGNHGKKCITGNDCLIGGQDFSVARLTLDSKNKAKLKKIYKFNEKSKRFGGESMKTRGIEAEVRTEHTESSAELERSVFPRIAAAAEAGWRSRDRRNFRDFEKRIGFYKLYLKTCGVNCNGIKRG